MITNTPTGPLSNTTLKWALIAGLILIIVTLALLSSVLPSTVGSSRAEALATPSSTPAAPRLTEFAASFTANNVELVGQIELSGAVAVAVAGSYAYVTA